MIQLNILKAKLTFTGYTLHLPVADSANNYTKVNFQVSFLPYACLYYDT